MFSKYENVKVGVSFSHSAGSFQLFEHTSHYMFVDLLMRALWVIVRKQEKINEIIEQIITPASVLLSLTLPGLLLCVSGNSLVVFWGAIPIIIFGIACGILLYRHRSKTVRSPRVLIEG